MSSISESNVPKPAAPEPVWLGSKPIAGGLKRTAVRSWAVTMFGQGAKFVINLVTTAIVARILTPNDYGLVAMVTAFLSFISLFKDLGLSQATVQRETITQQQVSGLFWFNVAMGLLIMLVTAATAPLVSRFYGQAELTWICLAYAAMAPISALGAQHGALLRRSMHYRSLALRDLVATCIGAAVGILCAMSGFGYWSLVIMQAVTEVAGTLTLWWQSGWRPSRPRWSDDLKPLLRFGGTLTLSNLLGFVMSGLDSVVIGFFFGPTGLGLYNRAQNTLSRPLKQLLPPIMNVAGSAFARAASDPKKFESGTLQIVFFVSCISSLIVAIGVSCTDWIVLIMLGPAWSEAVPIARVLALFAFVEPVATLMATLLTARGMPEKLVRWRIVSAGIIIIGIIAGLPWGPLGVATAYSLSGFFIRTPVFVWYATTHLTLDSKAVFRKMGLPLLAGAFATASLFLMRTNLASTINPFTGLLVFALVSTVLFTAFLGLFPAGRQQMRIGFDMAIRSLKSTPSAA